MSQARGGRPCPKLDLQIHQSSAVGVSHNNPDGSSRQQVIRRLSIGNYVHLEREPHCPYDANAIQCWSVSRDESGIPEECFGYLKKEIALEIAPEMDRGIRWGAIVGDLPGRTTKGVVLMLGRLEDQSPPRPPAVQEEEIEMETPHNEEKVCGPIEVTAIGDEAPVFINVPLYEAFAAFNSAEENRGVLVKLNAEANDAFEKARLAKEQADAQLAAAVTAAKTATETLMSSLREHAASL